MGKAIDNIIIILYSIYGKAVPPALSGVVITYNMNMFTYGEESRASSTAVSSSKHFYAPLV